MDPEIIDEDYCLNDRYSRQEWIWRTRVQVPYHLRGAAEAMVEVRASVLREKKTGDIWKTGLEVTTTHRGKRQKGTRTNHFLPRYLIPRLRKIVEGRIKEAVLWLTETLPRTPK